MNYYNENDPKAAAWLRELIAGGHIANGVVDERSILEIKPHELSSFVQCHFFAGIGGWSPALRLAGWSDDRPVWTGSCPCQPYSSAGKGLGDADPRNLWPAFFNLIRECRPDTVFGEQVESAIGHGWLDGISADLEGEDYACGAAVLGAHSVGAPHIRQRLYWVAYRKGQRWDRLAGMPEQTGRAELETGDTTGGLALPNHTERGSSVAGRNNLNGNSTGRHEGNGKFGECSETGAWSRFELILCRDGKARRIESGLEPLAHGVPHRVGLLRGYGNAIVPQTAAQFILAAFG